MRLATVLTPISDTNLQLAAQCGVTDVVHRYPGEDIAVLRTAQQRIASFGMRLAVVEGYLPIENIKLGCDDGRELAALKTLIRQMAELDIRLLSYNFMPGTDWLRTRLDAPERGGTKVTAFDLAVVEHAVRLGYRPPNAEFDEMARKLTPATLWQNLERLLNELLPVAEECGVTLAMHPDDPPLPELLGKPRIMHNVEGFERLMKLAPSPANAICFCQGTFATMNVNIPATIRRLGPHIKYVHFRDVRGNPRAFAETFHDNGPTDMAAAMRAYREIGFDGPVRPDHVPQMVGEDDGEPGYTMLGRLFAFGYMRGLMQATEPETRRQLTRQQATTALSRIIGLPLTIARRAADMRVFHFGAVRQVDGGSIGDFALHIQCSWRIDGPDGIVTGRSDLWRPVKDNPPIDSYEDLEKWPNLQDTRIDQWLAENERSLVVVKVDADDCGGATIHLGQDFVLRLFPAGIRGEDWRLLGPDEDAEHFVIRGGAVETDDEPIGS